MQEQNHHKINNMLIQINRSQQSAQKFRKALENYHQNEENFFQMLNYFQQTVIGVTNIANNIDNFSDQIIFSNKAEVPIPEPITTEKIGNFEHQISEQIERIDNVLEINYTEYNRVLSKQIIVMNRTIDNCLNYLMDKL